MVIAAAPGRTIEHLRGPLGLTQPGATASSSAWSERAGLSAAIADRATRTSLTLSDAGEAVLEQMHAARRAALTEALAPLAPSR